MESIGNYAFRTTTTLSFDEAINQVISKLGEHGFGVLTEIDVQATFKKKLDIDTQPYRILGVCNPPFSKKALESEKLIGVLLPCNVVVWDEGGYRVVAAMDPRVMSYIIDDPVIKEVATEVVFKLADVIESFD